GLDTIDFDAAHRHGVSVRWTAGVNRQAVAEVTIAVIIAVARHPMPLAREMRDGVWTRGGGRQLSSATVGVIGCGHVGKTVARLCRAFGATVLAHDIVHDAAFDEATGVRPVDLDTLLAESDFVTIH